MKIIERDQLDGDRCIGSTAAAQGSYDKTKQCARHEAFGSQLHMTRKIERTTQRFWYGWNT